MWIMVASSGAWPWRPSFYSTRCSLGTYGGVARARVAQGHSLTLDLSSKLDGQLSTSQGSFHLRAVRLVRLRCCSIGARAAG